MSVTQYAMITASGFTAALAMATFAKPVPNDPTQVDSIPAFEQSLSRQYQAGSGPDARLAANLLQPSFIPRGPLTLDELAHIRLQDQDGQAFSMADLKGKTVLVNFMFASCIAICPTQTASLRQVYRGLKLQSSEDSGIQLLSISIAPLSDTPRRLKAFAKRFDTDGPNWRFAVASQAQTDELARQFSVGVKPLERDQLDHRSLLYLINPKGVMIQQYRGNRVDVERLVRELALVDELG